MDRVKPTVKGIQHFSKSHTDRVVFTGKYGCGPTDTVNDNPDNAHTQELLELQMYKYMRDNMKYKKDEDEQPGERKKPPIEDIPENKKRLLNMQFFNEFKN